MVCIAAQWKVVYMTWQLKIPSSKNVITRASKTFARGNLSLVDCAFKSPTVTKLELRPVREGDHTSTVSQIILWLRVRSRVVDKQEVSVTGTLSTIGFTKQGSPSAGPDSEDDSNPEGLSDDDDDIDDATKAKQRKHLTEVTNRIEKLQQEVRRYEVEHEKLLQLEAQDKTERAEAQRQDAAQRVIDSAILKSLQVDIDKAFETLRLHDQRVAQLNAQLAHTEEQFRETIRLHQEEFIRREDAQKQSLRSADNSRFQLAAFVFTFVFVIAIKLISQHFLPSLISY